MDGSDVKNYYETSKSYGRDLVAVCKDVKYHYVSPNSYGRDLLAVCKDVKYMVMQPQTRMDGTFLLLVKMSSIIM